MSNRFEKAINLKKANDKNNEILNGYINVKENQILNENISENTIKNKMEIKVENKLSIKEKLKKLDDRKTQITINVKNENLKKLDLLSKSTKKSRAFIIDYLLENYLD